jgi:hypothetical protein
MNMSFENKVALVTGAGSGMGSRPRLPLQRPEPQSRWRTSISTLPPLQLSVSSQPVTRHWVCGNR